MSPLLGARQATLCDPIHITCEFRSGEASCIQLKVRTANPYSNSGPQLSPLPNYSGHVFLSRLWQTKNRFKIKNVAGNWTSTGTMSNATDDPQGRSQEFHLGGINCGV